MERWARFNYQPSIPLGKNGGRVTASEEHIALSRRAACEGMVLLKNENGLLPLKGGTRAALFGRGQIDYIKGGGGSGVVSTAYTRNIFEGMEIKQQEGKIELFRELSEFYESALAQECAMLNSLDRKVYAMERLINGVGSREPEVPDELMDRARAFADTAIVVISRYSCEKYDRNAEAEGGDFYLSKDEKTLVARVKERFSHIAVVLNVGGIVDVSWFSDEPGIEAALLAWQSGIEGGLAVADILCGDALPSGRLTDTIARRYEDYPSSKYFGESEEYVCYSEDIFVGYRFFETVPGAADRVIYPFGYGLGYTEFSLDRFTCAFSGTEAIITAQIKNTGKMPGREVVQAYIEPPTGALQKPKRVLTAFVKTETIEPGEEREIKLSFDLKDFASYDDTGLVLKSAFILEKGDYGVLIGGNVRSAKRAFTIELESDIIVKRTSARACPRHPLSRMRADGSFEKLAPEERELDKVSGAAIACAPAKSGATLFDVAEKRIALDELIMAMSTEELGYLLYGHNTFSASPTNGIGGGGRKSKRAIPLLTTADGPAGLRIPPEVGITTSAFPCATQLACSWDTELVERVDAAIAAELRENNIAIYLAPALNIHRDPLCGRNFEYYSEDPLVSGKMAAAAVRGIQSMGVAATLKHFAMNGKEINRRNSDSRASEKALREVYLRGFEIAVREGRPWALMTAYNKVNGVRASQNYDLITGILRQEWGFDGLVMTDWHVFGEEIDELLAGNDVKMPEAMELPAKRLSDIPAAVASGALPLDVVRESAKRVLELILRLE